jgi:hypothetical protein
MECGYRYLYGDAKIAETIYTPLSKWFFFYLF